MFSASTTYEKQLRKRGYLIRFGHTEALLLKKMTLNGHFSRPAETDPYEKNKERKYVNDDERATLSLCLSIV